MNWSTQPESWRFIFLKYLPRLAIGSLVWEILQLPLYTLWSNSPWEQIAFAVAHCTIGDVMIGMASLLIALILCAAESPRNWPKSHICLLTIAMATAYTMFSERMNLAQGSWSYSAWMPVFPWIEVGLAPVAQWIAVPLFSWWWSNRAPHHAPEYIF